MGKPRRSPYLLLGLVVIAGLVLLLALVSLFGRPSALRTTVFPGDLNATPPNFKVAFIGDQNIGNNARSVLELIKSENADMAIVSGDLGYNESDPNTPQLWNQLIDQTLGPNFPLFITQGNHDIAHWGQYQQLAQERLARIPGANCTGDLGVKSACTYQGLFFLLTKKATDSLYYRNQLAQDNSVWRICAWHQNQDAMQLGSKPDEVGWGPYEECRRGRAIITTAHEHSYQRTKTLTDMASQTVDPAWPDPNNLSVSSGSTFAFVSGLGGHSIRDQRRCLPTDPPYGCQGEWANVYTASQSATYGALFIEFHVDGNPNKARGYFKTINNEIIDSFTINADTSTLAPTTIIPAGASWNYLDNGSNQATAWREVAFDDSAWASGPAQLGYGDGDEATNVSFGPNPSSKYTTTYFRHSFNLDDPQSVGLLSLGLLRDDGAVVYLNGVEIYRSNMPSGQVTASTFAASTIGGQEENRFFYAPLSPVLLKTGQNVLAVEIHQTNLTSSDISFDFILEGQMNEPQPPATPPPPPPGTGNGGGGNGGGGNGGNGGGGNGGGESSNEESNRPQHSAQFPAATGHKISGSYSGLRRDGNLTVAKLAHSRARLERKVSVPLGDYWLFLYAKHDRPGPVKLAVYLNNRAWKVIELAGNDDKYRVHRVGLLRGFRSGTIRFRLLNDAYDRSMPTDEKTDRNLYIAAWGLNTDANRNPIVIAALSRATGGPSASPALLPRLNQFIREELGAHFVNFDIWFYYAKRLTTLSTNRVFIGTESRLRNVMRFWRGVSPNQPRGE